MSKKITVVDADSVAYRCAAASEKRSILVKHKSGKEKEFNTRTEFKNLLKSKDKLDKLDEYIIEDVQTPEPIENCLYSVKSNIDRIKERTQADELIILVGGKSNYREQLPLPSKYKGSREDTIRPIHLKEAKNYLLDKHKAEEIQGIEADDECIIRSYYLKSKGYDVTIATVDKDAFQVEDFKMYNYADDVLFNVAGHTIEQIVKGKGKKIVGSGVGFLAYQMLVGDSTDCYNPTEIAGIKYGDASAYKALKDCKTPHDYLKVVVEKYREWYPTKTTYLDWQSNEQHKDWSEILDIYYKCSYMLRTLDDKADSKEFFAKYGVDL